MIPVIICGGFGTKLWPISREHKPKHFLPLIDGKSMFQINYEALLMGYNPSEIFVSTVEDQLALAKEQAPEIPDDNFILEPEMRNQGPATGLVAASLYNKGYADEPFMIIQSDVLREPGEKFLEMLKDCDTLARNENKYITGGLKPESAVMGVDYLVKGERVTSEDKVGIYKVKEFVWRSSKEETEELIKRDDALIHTNHSCMTPKNFLAMLEKYKPGWYGPLKNIAEGADVKTEFSKMEPGPIEDVTQEVHANGESLVIELPFKWYDIGTFESLNNYLRQKGLYKIANNIIEIKSEENFVKLDDENKVVALIGVSNLVVVDTGDVLLICNREDSSEVKEARSEAVKRNLALT